MTAKRQVAILVLLVGLLIALLAAGRVLLKNELSPVGIGAKAPDFTANTLDESPRTKSLDDYRGNVVVINIWATWCGPCRIEMPSIEQLHRAYAPRGLRIVAVSVDDPGMAPQIRSFVKEFGLTFEVLHDPGGQQGKISRDYQTTGYPETVIIGRDGIIRKKLLGAHDWNSPENRALIERLLAEKAE